MYIAWGLMALMSIYGIFEVATGNVVGIVYIIGAILCIFVLIFAKIYSKEKDNFEINHSQDDCVEEKTGDIQQIQKYNDNQYIIIHSKDTLLNFFKNVDKLKNNTELCELINNFEFDTKIIDFFMKIIVNVSDENIFDNLDFKNYKVQIIKASQISKNLSLSNNNVYKHIQTYKYDTLLDYKKKKINITFKEFPEMYHGFSTRSLENILYFKDSLILNKIISSEKFDIDSLYFLLWLQKENFYKKRIQDLYEDYELSYNTNLETKVNILFYDSPLNKDEIINLLFIEYYLNQDELSLSTITKNSEIKIALENLYNKIESKEFLNTLKNRNNTEDNITEIEKIDIMSGYQFEDFVMKLFEKMGYAVEHTPLSGDQGVDLIVKKGTQIIAIQTKCFRTQKIGNKAIQEVVAGAKFYGANKMIVITNSYFTRSAIELASIHNVELWDRNVLSSKIQR